MAKQLNVVLLTLATCALCSSAEQLGRANSISSEPFAGTRGLIDNVVSNLQQVASEAGQAVTNFTGGIQDQVKEFREDLAAEAEKLSDAIQDAISNVTSNILGVSSGINQCILTRKKAAVAALHDAVYNATSCAESRLQAISDLVTQLIAVTKSAADAAMDVQTKAIECSNSSSNIFTVGTCLGGLLLNSEVKAATIAGQSALLIARINLSLASLPARLNICAASKFVKAALGVGRLDVSLAQCSLSAVAGSL